MQILDCTLRDGGYYNNWSFPSNLVKDYLDTMAAIGVDIVEIGLRTLKTKGFSGASAYTSDHYLSGLSIPESLKVAVMINASELAGSPNIEDALSKLFPASVDNSPVDIVRVACHVHEFEKALPAATWLKKKGFTVGFNLMQIADRTGEEITQLAKIAQSYSIDVLYFADSMGSLSPEETQVIIGYLSSEWRGELGIHTHDNLGLALSNTLCALKNGVSWVDSTVTGMGRGPGNTRTEELIIEVAKLRGKQINLTPIMSLLKKHFSPLKEKHGWGTNPYYYLAGKYGIHPTYIQEMLSDSRYDEEDILSVIEYLREEGGKKFHPNTLNSARHFFQGEPQGKWNASELIHGKNILLLGAGPSAQEHRAALEEYIRREKPLVIALNTQSSVEQSLIDLRVACHPIRLLADGPTLQNLPQPLITPFSMLPNDIRVSLEGKHIFDFGINVEPDGFSFEEGYASVPTSLVMAYALAICASGKAKTVLMAGFDGYGADDPRTQEVEKLLRLYQSHQESCPLMSVTPTKYSLETRSIYSL